MAEPLIDSDSPLGHYLEHQLPLAPRSVSSSSSSLNPSSSDHQQKEQDLNHHQSLTTTTTTTTTTSQRSSNRSLMNSRFTSSNAATLINRSQLINIPLDILNRFKSLFLNISLLSNHHPNHSHTNLSSSYRDHQPEVHLLDQQQQQPPPLDLQDDHHKIQQDQLSERLKYLICSSFLLNPDLQPTFYDTHPTPPMVSELESFQDPVSQSSSSSSSSSNTNQSNQLHLNFSLRHLRRQPQIALGSLIVLILIGYHLSPSWLLLSLPLLAFSVVRTNRLTLSNHHHHHLHYRLQLVPQPSPQESQLQIQSQLVPQVAKLVNISQILDHRISRAIGAVKEIECVALGLGLSNPMPPISRLENAAFPFTTNGNPSASTLTHPLDDRQPHDSLHALGVRKVLQRVLDQAKHDYENAAVELSSMIADPALSPDGLSPPPSSITLAALMEMYACAHNTTGEISTNLKRSASERARRQAWRASLHSRIHGLNNPLATPTISTDSTFVTSTPPASKRYSLQSPCSPMRSPLDPRLHHRSRESGKSTSLSRHSWIALSENSRSASPASKGSDLHTPNSRPLSLCASNHPSPPSSAGPQCSSFYFSTSKPSPTLNNRHSFVYNTSARTGPSPAISLTRRSPDLFMSGCSESPTLSNLDSSASPPEESQIVERVIPYSLTALHNAFEHMHTSRKRLMCCILALDFATFTPVTLSMWQDTLEKVRDLIKTVEGLGTELTEGMSSEFGPGSFENTPVSRVESRTGDKPKNPTVRKEDEEGEDDDLNKEHVIRDFAPSIPASVKRARRHDDLLSQMQSMDLALRSISAKMKVCVEELDKELERDEPYGSRAISVHESIRADLESLAREWDESRSKIRVVVEGEKALAPSRNRLRPHSLDSNERCFSMSSGRDSSVYSSEVLTPVGEHEAVSLYETEQNGDDNGEEEEEEEGKGESESLLIEKRSRVQAMAPPPGLEEILEGVIVVQEGESKAKERLSLSETSKPKVNSPIIARHSLRLSRDEQIELTRRRRESIPMSLRNQARSRPQSAILTSAYEPGQSGLNKNSMVTELKDVLHALKNR